MAMFFLESHCYFFFAIFLVIMQAKEKTKNVRHRMPRKKEGMWDLHRLTDCRWNPNTKLLEYQIEWCDTWVTQDTINIFSFDVEKVVQGPKITKKGNRKQKVWLVKWKPTWQNEETLNKAGNGHLMAAFSLLTMRKNTMQ